MYSCIKKNKYLWINLTKGNKTCTLKIVRQSWKKMKKTQIHGNLSHAHEEGSLPRNRIAPGSHSPAGDVPQEVQGVGCPPVSQSPDWEEAQCCVHSCRLPRPLSPLLSPSPWGHLCHWGEWKGWREGQATGCPKLGLEKNIMDSIWYGHFPISLVGCFVIIKVSCVHKNYSMVMELTQVKGLSVSPPKGKHC